MASSQVQTCQACNGRGVLNSGRGMQVCPLCNGSGVKAAQPFRVPYDYVIPNAVLLANQVGLVVPLAIQQDADFEWIFTVSSQTGLYSVQLLDSSTGRALSNAAVNGENFAGTAQLPAVNVEPYIWARSSNIQAVFNDRSGAGNTIQLTLRGYKLFPQSNPSQGSAGQQ